MEVAVARQVEVVEKLQLLHNLHLSCQWHGGRRGTTSGGCGEAAAGRWCQAAGTGAGWSRGELGSCAGQAARHDCGKAFQVVELLAVDGPVALAAFVGSFGPDECSGDGLASQLK